VHTEKSSTDNLRLLVILNSMSIHTIIAALDEEITKLQNARALILNNNQSVKRGRPVLVKTAPAKKRGAMSLEGRKRIAAAQRKRWRAIHAAKAA
jgi:hypothetical protein